MYKDKFFEYDGTSLHYLDWENNGKPTMVLLHGLTSNSHFWDFFVPEVQQDFHVLALDQRGHGDSSWTGHYGPKYYVQDLEKLITALKQESIVLVGFSLGGIVAMSYASRHPDIVSRLVIVDMAPETERTGVQRILREQAQIPPFFAGEKEALQYLQKCAPHQSHEFIQNKLAHGFNRTEDGRLVPKNDPALQTGNVSSPTWLWEHLPNIICPTLLIRGEKSDLVSQTVAEQTVEALPQGSLVTISASGHSVPGDNPEEFAGAVQAFVSQTVSA